MDMKIFWEDILQSDYYLDEKAPELQRFIPRNFGGFAMSLQSSKRRKLFLIFY